MMPPPTTGAAGSGGLTPVDTDGDGTADVIDTDSDNDGIADVTEAGHGITQADIDASGDADGDGIADVVDDVAGFDPNDADIDGSGNFTLADSDGDTGADGSGATPLVNDLDFRDDTASDYVVEGDNTGNLIDGSYTGDPDGDRVDSGDHSDGSDNDSILGHGGDDTILAGSGNDTVYGGDGADQISGGDGDDLLVGGGDPATSVGGTSTVGLTYTVISLGTMPEVDTTEGNGTNENPGALLGTYGGPGNELYNNILEASTTDTNASTDIDLDDQAAPEEIVIDGTGVLIDAGMVYDATVTFTDGTTGTFTAVVIQTVDGEVYLMPEMTDNADNTLLTSAPIESISLDSVNTGYTLINSERVDADYALPGDTDVFGDTLIGGTGDDTMFGGLGNDTFYVAEGDSAVGGDGEDLFILTDLGEAGSGTITIDGGNTGEPGGDTLDLGGVADRTTLTFAPSVDDPDAITGSVTLLDGTVVTFTDIEHIICFTPGTLIATPEGDKPVEKLRPGDMVLTLDDGPQPLRWAGTSTVPGRTNHAPIRIAPGLLGNDRPLTVSPQHRLLIDDWRAELLFGDRQVFVTAKQMLDRAGVTACPVEKVTYIHLMFDRHQIVLANGAATESLHASDDSLAALAPAARAELFACLPGLRGDVARHGPTARRCLKSWEAQVLLSRPFCKLDTGLPIAA